MLTHTWSMFFLYSLKEKEQVQSFHFNPHRVTLHPVVLYWGTDGKVAHSSMVMVSEVLNQNASTVQAIVDKLIPEAKAVCQV